MHVTHVINRFGISGGAENQLTMNLSHFDDESIYHDVVVLYRDDPAEEQILPHVNKTFLFGDGDEPSRLEVFRRLSARLQARSPDLVHCSLADAALASRVVGLRQRIPVLESLVNISHEPVRTVDNPAVRPWKLAAHRWLDRYTMRGVFHFHALTRAVAESWVEQVGIDPDTVTVIPRGVDLTRFELDQFESERRRVRAELGLSEGQPLVLNVGRQEAQKGQRYLIEAMPAILAGQPDATLVIAGREGNATSDLRRRIDQLSLGHRVRFVGVRHDISAVLFACDVFVFPSLFEGLGVSLLEAMAASRPCVVSRIGPFEEVVVDGESGLMAEPGNPGAISDQVLRVLAQPHLASQLATAARRRVEDEFEIGGVASLTQSLYRQLFTQIEATRRP